MLISEVLTAGDPSCADDEDAVGLRRIERLVCRLEQSCPQLAAGAVEDLRECVIALGSAKLSEEQKLQIWKLSYRIWNTCVDVANHLQQQQLQGPGEDHDHVRLRQIASDMLLVAGSIESIRSSALKIGMFLFRTGTAWHKAGNNKLAAACFDKATEVVSSGDSASPPAEQEEQQFMFDLCLARSKTAWEMSQRALASSLLGRARGMLVEAPSSRYQELASAYLHYGKSLLSKEDHESKAEAVKYIEQAYDICCQGLRTCNDPADERALTSQKLSILRHIAAGQLRNGNFEGVLKCVAILKASPTDHPGTLFLAIQALAGMNRHEEAEQELLSLVCHDKATVDVCISALDLFIHGQDERQLDAAKRAFFILQSRFPSNNEIPLKLAEKLLKQAGQSSLPSVELALTIATDDRTLKSFSSGVSRLQSPALHCQKELQYMQALLWNSGSDFFQAKDYRTAIKLFEASMLYLPPQEETLSMRSKALRVLCLCHLGLSQYDRAAECVEAGEKMEPSVACSFLKFKICLQLNDENGAVNGILKMMKCSDFEPDYLTLAAHEAVACKSIKVAVSALSTMLDLLSSTSMPSSGKEVTIFRNLIFLAAQDTECQQEAVKHLLQARTRLAQVGPDNFLGPGINGQKEANWFGGCAWNQGLAAAKRRDWKCCSELFACASDFLALLPDSEDNLKSLETALLLTVSALLAGGGNEPDTLKLASLNLEKCRKVHDVLLSKSKTHSRGSFYLNLLAFDLKGRMAEYKEQLDIMYQCASLPGFKPEYYFKMGMLACSGKGGNTEVPVAAFRTCLNLLLSSPAPDYKRAAMTLRKLILLSDKQNKDGPGVLKHYQEANRILLGLKNDEYPHEEVQWLVSTAWNRAALHVKLSRYSAAEQWMRIALDLVKHAPNMDMHRPAMVESLNKVLKQQSQPELMVEE